MSYRPDDRKWEYWVRVDRWSHVEATLILEGVIPSKSTLDEAIYGSNSHPISFYEAEGMSKFIGAKFGKKSDVSPNECLSWAIQSEIKLNAELLAAATRVLKIKNAAKDQNKGETGQHWSDKRGRVLALALHLLSKPPEEFKNKFWLKGRINSTQLAKAVEDHRFKIFKDEVGLEPKTIREIVRRAVGNGQFAVSKSKPRVSKSTD